MKWSQVAIFLLGAFALLGRAQDLANYPDVPLCATACMVNIIPNSVCSNMSKDCLCTNMEVREEITQCVLASCTMKDGLTMQHLAAGNCDWPVRNVQPVVRRVIISFFTLCTFFYVARMASRLPMFGGEVGPDDYVITLSYLLAIGHVVVIVLLSRAGLGKDIWEVPFMAPNDEVTYTLQLFTALEKLYIATVWTTKVSMLLVYLRIFPHPHFRVRVKFVMAFCIAAGFCLFFSCLFKCWPISFSWTFWDGEHQGSCSNMNAQGWANAGLDIFGDLVVITLPWPIIRKLTMSKGKKIGIMIMFGIGLFITIVSIVRLYTLKLFNFSRNPTWDFVNLSMWSAIEVFVGIICACLPGTRNFYSRVINGHFLRKGQFANLPSRKGSPSSGRHALNFYHSNSSQSTTSCPEKSDLNRNISTRSKLSDNTVTTMGTHLDDVSISGSFDVDLDRELDNDVEKHGYLAEVHNIDVGVAVQVDLNKHRFHRASRIEKGLSNPASVSGLGEFVFVLDGRDHHQQNLHHQPTFIATDLSSPVPSGRNTPYKMRSTRTSMVIKGEVPERWIGETAPRDDDSDYGDEDQTQHDKECDVDVVFGEAIDGSFDQDHETDVDNDEEDDEDDADADKDKERRLTRKNTPRHQPSRRRHRHHHPRQHHDPLHQHPYFHNQHPPDERGVMTYPPLPQLPTFILNQPLPSPPQKVYIVRSRPHSTTQTRASSWARPKEDEESVETWPTPMV